MAEEDRRRWKRLRTELPLWLEFDDDVEVTAVGSHFSPEGIFVRMSSPPQLGAQVRVTLSAEGTDGVLSAHGEVVDRTDDTAGGPPGVGIRLISTGGGWKKLYDWLLARP